MNIQETLKRFVVLDDAKRKLKAQQEEVEAEIAVLREEIFNFYSETGTSSMKIDGKTIYTSRTIWAGNADEVDSETVTKALMANGLGYMATYNHNSISGWVRNLAREHGLCNKDDQITGSPEEISALLPDEIKPLVKITDKFDLRVRKG